MLIVKFIESNNKSMLGLFEGLVGNIGIGNGIFYTAKDDNFNQGFRTSLVDTIFQNDNLLTVITLNSIYKFEVIEGNIKEYDLSSLDKNRPIFDKYAAVAKEKSSFFSCQVGGNAFIDGAYSLAKLPEPMFLEEAKEYINNNILLDLSGEIVVNIVAPYTKPISE